MRFRCIWGISGFLATCSQPQLIKFTLRLMLDLQHNSAKFKINT